MARSYRFSNPDTRAFLINVYSSNGDRHSMADADALDTVFFFFFLLRVPTPATRPTCTRVEEKKMKNLESRSGREGRYAYLCCLQ